MSTPAGHRFVFLGGLHRSGTSILFRGLREHPRISGFRDSGVPEDEGQHLQTVFLPAKAYGGPGKFVFDPGARLTESSPLATEENRRRLFGEWARYWDTSRPVLLEKSPPNLIRSRFLQALFPDSSFVMLVRHPVAVSFATKKWSKTSMGSLLRHWLSAHEIFAEDRPHLRRALAVKYEDLVGDPPATMDRLYAFLGLETAGADFGVKRDINRAYFERWRRNAARPLLRPYYSRLIERYEARVNRFGYSLRDLELVAPFEKPVAAGAALASPAGQGERP